MKRHVVSAERFSDLRLRSVGSSPALHSSPQQPDVSTMSSLHNAAGYLRPRRALSVEPPLKVAKADFGAASVEALSEAMAMGAAGPSPKELRAKEDMRAKKKGLLRKQQDFLQEQTRQTMQQQQQCQEMQRLEHEKLVEAEARAAKAEARAELVLQQAERMESHWKEQAVQAERLWKQQADRVERDMKERLDQQQQLQLQARASDESSEFSRVLTFCQQFETRLTTMEKQQIQQQQDLAARAASGAEASGRLYGALPEAVQLKLASNDKSSALGCVSCGADASASLSFSELVLGLRGLVDHATALLVAKHAEEQRRVVDAAADAEPDATIAALLAESGDDSDRGGGGAREVLFAERSSSRRLAEKRRKAFAAASQGLAEAMYRVSEWAPAVDLPGQVPASDPGSGSSAAVGRTGMRAAAAPSGSASAAGAPVGGASSFSVLSSASVSSGVKRAGMAAAAPARCPGVSSIPTGLGAAATPTTAAAVAAPPLHAIWRGMPVEDEDDEGEEVLDSKLTLSKGASTDLEVVKSGKGAQPANSRSVAIRSIVMAMIAALLVVYELVMVPLLVFRRVGVDGSGQELSDVVQFAILVFFALYIVRDCGAETLGFLRRRRSRVSSAASCCARLVPDLCCLLLDIAVAVVVALQLVGSLGDTSVAPAPALATTAASLRIARILMRTPKVWCHLIAAFRVIALTSPAIAEVFDLAAWLVAPALLSLACAHAMACGLYAIGELFKYDGDNAWVASHPLSAADAYPLAAGWALSQFTLSSSEVRPGSIAERAYAALAALLASSLTAWFVARAAALAAPAAWSRCQQAKTLAGTSRYLKTNDVPESVRWHALTLISRQGSLTARAPKPVAAMASLELPRSDLGGELRELLYAQPLVFSQHPLWSRLVQAHGDAARMVCRSMRQMALEPSDTLFSAGEVATRAYVVLAGDIFYVRSPVQSQRNSRGGSTAPTDAQGVRCVPCAASAALAATTEAAQAAAEAEALLPCRPRCLQRGAWLAEPALWVSGWAHRGRAAAASGVARAAPRCELLSLGDIALQEVLLLPGLRHAQIEVACYARAYVRHVSEQIGWQNSSDIFEDSSTVMRIYRASLEERKLEIAVDP